MSRFLQNSRFEMSKANDSLCANKTSAIMVIIFIYIDELIIIGNDKDKIMHVKKELGDGFDMK